MYALWVHARDISTKAQADAVLAQAQACGVTDIFFQAIDDSGRAHFNSIYGFTKDTALGTFDPLGYLASSGIKAHAWLCVGTDILYVRPEWNARTTKKLSSSMPSWADFTMPAVRTFASNWCASIAQAYPGVGIHLDYMRWHTDYGDNHLSWATATPITQTVQLIASLCAGSHITAAVSSDPTGALFGNLQNWGAWFNADYIREAVIMAYPKTVPELQSMMTRCAAYDRSRIVIGLSGLYFTYSPSYGETPIAPLVLADLVAWSRQNGYTNFAWFDYTKISGDQYAVIGQIAPPSQQQQTIIQKLGVISADLAAISARLASESANVKAKSDAIAEILANLG